MPELFNKRDGKDCYPCWAVYIGRPSRWGNPFVIGKDGTREDVIRKYEAWLLKNAELFAAVKLELKGKDITLPDRPFFCDRPCFGSSLLLFGRWGGLIH